MDNEIEFDAVVIGAGVVGLAIANELCDNFSNILVLEKEADFGQHVSSRHSGVIHSGIYYERGSLKAELSVEGNKLLYDFAKKNRIEYLNCGKLIVGHNKEDLEELVKLLKNGEINGVEGLKLFSHHEAIEKESAVKCKNALWVPSSGVIDSHGLMLQLENNISQKGGIMYYNSEVIEIEKHSNSYNISIGSKGERIVSPIVINSAGLWCDAVSRMLNINEYKIHFCKGDYYQSNRYKNLNCLIYPLPNNLGLGVHAVLQLDGSVSFGPNAYYVDNIDYSIDTCHLDFFYNSVNKYLDINKSDLKVDYSGIRPKPFGEGEQSKDFIIKNENDRGFPNFINLIGIESPGLTSSLAIGKYVKGLLI